jgi:hypothetical protein
MAAPEMSALLKRSKRSVAVHMKTECSKQHEPQKLTDLLDHLLNPEKPIDDFETLDWCRWLISGGSTFEEFTKTGACFLASFLPVCWHIVIMHVWHATTISRFPCCKELVRTKRKAFMYFVSLSKSLSLLIKFMWALISSYSGRAMVKLHDG